MFKGKARNKGKDEAYEHRELYKLLSVCGIRLKLIVLIYSSTGIRADALPPLKLKHISKISIEGGQHIYKFNIYDTDNDFDADGTSSYYTLCTPECAKALDEYLEYRKRHFETLNPKTNQLEPEAPLIREDFPTQGFIMARQKPRHITASTIRTMLIDKLNKIGLREVDHVNGGRSRKRVKVIYGMRKFFKTQMLQCKPEVSFLVTKMLMNHDIKLEENYFRPSQAFVISEYSKAIPALILDPIARMARRIQTLEVEKTQFDRLAARIRHSGKEDQIRNDKMTYCKLRNTIFLLLC